MFIVGLNLPLCKYIPALLLVPDFSQPGLVYPPRHTMDSWMV